MKCILVFDHLNDVLYAKYNKKFSKHVRKLSQEQGFIPDGKVYGCNCDLRKLPKLMLMLAPFSSQEFFSAFRMMMSLAIVF